MAVPSSDIIYKILFNFFLVSQTTYFSEKAVSPRVLFPSWASRLALETQWVFAESPSVSLSTIAPLVAVSARLHPPSPKGALGVPGIPGLPGPPTEKGAERVLGRDGTLGPVSCLLTLHSFPFSPKLYS